MTDKQHKILAWILFAVGAVIILTSCEKQGECATLVSYGGNASGAEITAHYSDGSTLTITDDTGLPFPEVKCN